MRVHVAERPLTTLLVLDTSASMQFGTADRRKADVAEGVALALGHVGQPARQPPRAGRRSAARSRSRARPAGPRRPARDAARPAHAARCGQRTARPSSATTLRAPRAGERGSARSSCSSATCAARATGRPAADALAARHDVLVVEIARPARGRARGRRRARAASIPRPAAQVRVDTASRAAARALRRGRNGRARRGRRRVCARRRRPRRAEHARRLAAARCSVATRAQGADPMSFVWPLALLGADRGAGAARRCTCSARRRPTRYAVAFTNVDLLRGSCRAASDVAPLRAARAAAAPRGRARRRHGAAADRRLGAQGARHDRARDGRLGLDGGRRRQPEPAGRRDRGRAGVRQRPARDVRGQPRAVLVDRRGGRRADARAEASPHGARRPAAPTAAPRSARRSGARWRRAPARRSARDAGAGAGKDKGARVILLLSDGQNSVGIEPDDRGRGGGRRACPSTPSRSAAEGRRRLGPGGSLIPVPPDPDALARVADATGGTFF